MKTQISEVLKEVQWMVENNSTVRDTARHFGCSKSKIHSDINKRLFYYASYNAKAKRLYFLARNLLDYNNSVKHIRGGQAVKDKATKK